MNHDTKNFSRLARPAVAALVASVTGLTATAAPAAAADIEQATVPDFDALRKTTDWSLRRFGDAAVVANAMISVIDRGIVSEGNYPAPAPAGRNWEWPTNLDTALTLMEEIAVGIDPDRYGPMESADRLSYILDHLDEDKVAVSYMELADYYFDDPTEEIRA